MNSSNASFSARRWLILGAIFAGTGVIFGAFGAHGLDDLLIETYKDVPPKVIAGQELLASYKYLLDFKTAAEYQMYHSFGLLVVGLLARASDRRSLSVAGWSFTIGILLFSGSLYVLVLTGKTVFGAIAPIGGTAMIVGWFALAYTAFTSSPSELESPT